MSASDFVRWILTMAMAMVVTGCHGNGINDNKIKLYIMDGGTIDVSDLRSFAEDGRFAGEQIQLANPTFLIRHPKGDLLWDTGHHDALAEKPNGTRFEEWHNRLKTGLIDQLQELGLKPSDIDYLSLSHLHPDHSGNANLFSRSTFIVQELERQYMFSEDVKPIFGASYAALEKTQTRLFKDEHDVFGDGSVVIYAMPGHTPGSCVLLVRLKKAGNILLSGDLYIHARGRELQTIPVFNMDKHLLINSRKKFEALAEKENARVVIQHNMFDFEALPRFPNFLD